MIERVPPVAKICTSVRFHAFNDHVLELVLRILDPGPFIHRLNKMLMRPEANPHGELPKVELVIEHGV